MAPVKKAYSRLAARKILKAHSNCNVTKNLDVLVRTALRTRKDASLTGCRSTWTTYASCNRMAP
jgi:hypothetical protein